MDDVGGGRVLKIQTQITFQSHKPQVLVDPREVVKALLTSPQPERPVKFESAIPDEATRGFTPNPHRSDGRECQLWRQHLEENGELRIHSLIHPDE